MNYGLRLKLRRVEKGLTQRQLAEKAGVTDQSISHFEREQREPRIGMARKIARALDCSVQDLFF